MTRWLIPTCLLALTLAAHRAGAEPAADPARVAELERKLDVLAEEVETLKLGAAADTTKLPAPRAGLGPAAARVYGVRSGVSIGGYGEMLYENFDRRRQNGALAGRQDRVDFLRQVFYVGYKFSDELLFNSEVEFEHAGVKDEAEVAVDPATGEGSAELSGEAGIEFAYVEWTRWPWLAARAGMLLVPLGFVNELHEPPVFLGARRPDVEQRIIPTTWRANGVELVGESANGLSYRAALTEGLDAARFSAAGGIRDGRQSGGRARATKPAVSARLDWTSRSGLLVGGALYAGDSWQGPQPAGVRLSARVTITEAHARLEWQGFEARALYAAGTLNRPEVVSDALGLTGRDRLGRRFSGGYVEGAFDVLARLAPGTRYGLLPYVRYEDWDTQQGVAAPGIEDPANHRTQLTLGGAFKPHPSVVVKLDRQQRRNAARTEVSQWNAALGYLF